MINKNIRMISILMSLIVFLSCISVQATINVESTVSTNTALEEVIQLLSSIGVENSDSNEYVTKDVFARYLVSAIKGDASGVKINYYNDTVIGDDANFLASIGVFDIPENKMFYPEELIRADEAVKAFINVICSGYSSSMKKRENIDYVRIAREIDLISYYSADANLTYRELTMLIYNALLVNSKSIGSISSDFAITYVNDENLLYKIHNIKCIEDTIVANPFASIYEDVSPAGVGTIIIGDKVFKYNGKSGEFLLGQYVKAYYNVETNEVVHITFSRHNTSVELLSEDIIGYSENELTYRDDNDKIKKLKLSTPLLIKNGESKFEAGTSDVRQAVMTPRSTISLSKKYGTDKYWIITVNTYKNGKITSIDAKDGAIYVDFYGTIKKIFITPKRDVFVQTYRTSDGSEINISDLMVGDFVSSAISDNGKIFKTYLCDKTVSGKVTSYGDGRYGKEYSVNDSTYYLDSNPLSLEEIVLGSQYVFVLDVFDRIISFESSDNKFILAYIYDCYISNKHLKRGYEYAIFTEKGKHVVVAATKKLKLNGVSKKPEELDSVLAPGGVLKKQLVRIEYNSDFEINKIETAKTASLNDEITGLSCVAPVDYRTVKKLNDSGHFVINPSSTETDILGYPYKANTIMFCIPNGEDCENDDFVISKVIDYFGNNDSSYASLYCFDDDTFVDVLLFNYDLYENKPKLNSETYVVNDFCYQIGKDDEFYLTLETLDSAGNLKYLKFLNEIYIAKPDLSGNLENYTLISSKDLSSIIGQGDIIQTGTTSSGYRRYIRILYDSSEKQAIWWNNSNSSDSQPLDEYISQGTGTRTRFVYGYVGKIGYTRSGSAYVYIYNIDTDELIEVISLSGNKRLYDSTCGYNELILETVAEISSSEITGDKNLATRLFVIHKGQSTTDVIMYNN